jgi:double-strand break repair protein MRE11
LRPEELNQQNIEALVAESNLKMEILPVTDLGMALHDFVNKDDKQAFYACVHQNLDVTQNKLTEEADLRQIQEESDVVVKVGEHMQVSFSFLLLTSAVVISITALRHGD